MLPVHPFEIVNLANYSLDPFGCLSHLIAPAQQTVHGDNLVHHWRRLIQQTFQLVCCERSGHQAVDLVFRRRLGESHAHRCGRNDRRWGRHRGRRAGDLRAGRLVSGSGDSPPQRRIFIVLTERWYAAQRDVPKIARDEG